MKIETKNAESKFSLQEHISNNQHILDSTRLSIWKTLLTSCLENFLEIEPENLYGRPEREKKDFTITENQIKKDAERSFIGLDFYASFSNSTLEILRRHLSKTLIEFFKDHPKLNYYQGFNSICSALLINELHLNKIQQSIPLPKCEETHHILDLLSRSLLKDHLSPTFDNTLIYLKITREIIFQVDFKYYLMLTSFAEIENFHFVLPWIITIFIHKLTNYTSALDLLSYCLDKQASISSYLSASFLLHPNIKRLVSLHYKKRQKMISNGQEHLFDSTELFCLIQEAPKEIGGEIKVNYLISNCGVLLEEFPVSSLLKCKVVSELNDDSAIYRIPRGTSSEEIEEIKKSRTKWRRKAGSQVRWRKISSFLKRNSLYLSAGLVFIVSVLVVKLDLVHLPDLKSVKQNN
eukprot:maker-scaffold_8-snap-gene-8.64-mRNA-1 protein AED:0.00 eAED:0.00 QI:125/1/1/1/1/1/2/320/406